MLRPRFPGAALILAVVVFAAPAWAHPGFPVSDLAATQMLPAPEFPPAMLSAAPETPGLPWPVVMIALLTLAACWRRPRRALVLALALVLAVFAFQNGLHSAHHAADHHHAVTCPVAS
ncbi:MAG TPA: hypothetical protein VFO18_15320, partial [Methylomirabilota bacterium]|nr:hypothetical protein [Methylomirabilota bacterium]